VFDYLLFPDTIALPSFLAEFLYAVGICWNFVVPIAAVIDVGGQRYGSLPLAAQNGWAVGSCFADVFHFVDVLAGDVAFHGLSQTQSPIIYERESHRQCEFELIFGTTEDVDNGKGESSIGLIISVGV
jgi:hypothetical protein